MHPGICSVDELILSHVETDTIRDLDNTFELCAFVDSFSMATVLYIMGEKDTWRCLNWSLQELWLSIQNSYLLMYLLPKDLEIFPNK